MAKRAKRSSGRIKVRIANPHAVARVANPKRYFCPVCLKPKPIQWCEKHGSFYTTSKGAKQKGSALARAEKARLLRLARKARPARKSRASNPSTKFQASLAKTLALRSEVPPEMRPLFDHLIVLAKDSHARGNAKRAGRELAMARRKATGVRVSNPKKRPKITKRSKRRRARVRTEKHKPARARKKVVTMAKRKRHRRKKNPTTHHRRRRHHRSRKANPLFTKKHRRHHRRRRNPSLPKFVKTAIGVGIGAASGAGVAYAADKLGIGTPMQRNVGMILAGVALAAGIGALTKSAQGASVGAGVAAVGATRALASAVPAAPSSSSVRGLGMGTGEDEVGRVMVDGIGRVVSDINEIGYVVDHYDQ